MKNRLYYAEVGESKITLVFLHYFGGSSNTWRKVIAELSHHFRCIAVDLPGFGDSQEKTEKLSVSECAKEVARVISHTELNEYILIGHSMGGKIAMSLASLQPRGLTALILVAPSPPTPEPMSDSGRRQLFEAYGDPVKLAASINNVTARPLSDVDMEDAVADNLKASHASWNWWAEQGSRENISGKMQTIRVPVKIISGAKDNNLSTAFLRTEMVKYFPSAVFDEIEHSGHLIPLEEPEALVKSIKESIKIY